MLNTGFEGLLIGIVVILMLFYFLRLALSRHVNITNNVSPTATASASGGESQKSGGGIGRLIGVSIALLFIVAVAGIVVSALGTHAAVPVAQPQAVPQIVQPVTIPIEVPAEYVPVELPAVPAIDFSPVIAMVALAAALGGGVWLSSKRKASAVVKAPVKISRINPAPEGLTADLFDEALRRKQNSERR